MCLYTSVKDVGRCTKTLSPIYPGACNSTEAVLAFVMLGSIWNNLLFGCKLCDNYGLATEGTLCIVHFMYCTVYVLYCVMVNMVCGVY